MEKVNKTIKELPQLPQVQYDTLKQLQQLYLAANKLGLYDAADIVRKYMI